MFETASKAAIRHQQSAAAAAAAVVTIETITETAIWWSIVLYWKTRKVLHYILNLGVKKYFDVLIVLLIELFLYKRRLYRNKVILIFVCI